MTMITNDQNEESKRKIGEDFERILKAVGFVPDGAYNMDTQPKEVADRLGRLFFDYMVASIYDTDWDGFIRFDVFGIRNLITDMAVYVEHSDDQDHIKKPV